jgi:imidazolonepropionase-like amidohydrolase
MRVHLAGLLAALLLAVAPELARRPSAGVPGPEMLALTNARLIDGAGGEPLEDAVIVIIDGRIAAAGPASEVAVPEAARVVDAAGGTVLPGLIDAHVHLSSALRRDPEAARVWLRAGVTTLADMGMPDAPDTLRNELAKSGGPTPRVLIAGPILTAPGGYPFVGPLSSALEVESPAAAERLLAPLLARPSVDHLKVALERGFTQDLDDDGWPVLDPAVLRAITAIAHAHGLRVSAHVTQPGELAAALAAGVDNAAHTPAQVVADAVLARAAAADFVLVSTASLWRETPRELANVQRNLRRYLELGGRVALGTDAPAFQAPGLPLAEMLLLRAGGLTPMQVLVAATRDAAFAFGRGDDLGRIAPGWIADLIVVRGDPSQDLAALAHVTLIIQGGRAVGFASGRPVP